jgi:hypothetical protein
MIESEDPFEANAAANRADLLRGVQPRRATSLGKFLSGQAERLQCRGAQYCCAAQCCCSPIAESERSEVQTISISHRGG